MKTEYKITIARIIQACWLQCIVFIGFYCIWVYMVDCSISMKNVNEILTPGFAILLFVDIIITGFVGIIPSLIYWNHYSYDKNSILTIDHYSNRLTYKNKTRNIDVNLSDILYIKQYNSRNRINMMHYYKLNLTDGTHFIVTSLLAPNLLKELNGVKNGRESMKDILIKL
jgi:hypothetical protein